MKRCERGSLPTVEMPLDYFSKIIGSYKPLFGKDNPVFISTDFKPYRIFEIIPETEEDRELIKKYNKDNKLVSFNLLDLKDV